MAEHSGLRAHVLGRWDMAATTVQRLEGEPYPTGEAPSEQLVAIYDAVEELAVRMIREVYPEETRSLDTVRDGIMDEIERRLIDWAVQIETDRVTRAAAA